MSPVKPGPAEMEELASRWAVRHAEGLGVRDRAEFERWLQSDPRHYAAFAEADLALSVLTPPGAAQDRDALRQELAAWEEQRRRRRSWGRRIAFASVGLAAAAALAVVFRSEDWMRTTAPSVEAGAATMAVRPRGRTLPDGSVVELNAGADLAVEFSSELRGVRLVRGEAHFSVAKDASRPFVVAVGPVKVRAVGTAFNVRFEPAAVQVLVTEGQVAVDAPLEKADRRIPGTPSTATGDLPLPLSGLAVGVADRSATAGVAGPSSLSPGHAPQLLAAGHRMVVALDPQAGAALAATPVSADEIQRELAWRQMRVELSNATLEEAVALFNRRGRVQVAIADAELKARRLSGIYWADSGAQFAELIAATLEIQIVQEEPGRILLRKR